MDEEGKNELGPPHFEEHEAATPERALWVAVLTLFVKDCSEWRGDDDRVRDLEVELVDPWFEQVCENADQDYRAFRDAVRKVISGERDLSAFAFNRAAKRPRKG